MYIYNNELICNRIIGILKFKLAESKNEYLYEWRIKLSMESLPASSCGKHI